MLRCYAMLLQCFVVLVAFVSNTLSAVAVVFRAKLEDFSMDFKQGNIKICCARLQSAVAIAFRAKIGYFSMSL